MLFSVGLPRRRPLYHSVTVVDLSGLFDCDDTDLIRQIDACLLRLILVAAAAALDCEGDGGHSALMMIEIILVLLLTIMVTFRLRSGASALYSSTGAFVNTKFPIGHF